MSAANLASLQQTKAQVLADLAAITANPKPSYSINGQNVQWTEYFDRLTGRVAELNRLIQVEGGPFELQTQAATGGAGGGSGSVWPV